MLLAIAQGAILERRQSKKRWVVTELYYRKKFDTDFFCIDITPLNFRGEIKPLDRVHLETYLQNGTFKLIGYYGVGEFAKETKEEGQKTN